MPYGEHTTHIVVSSSCKNASEDYPQIGYRSEFGSHDGTEDGTRTCDVQELNHENLPRGKYYKVNAVGLGHGRRNTIVGTKNSLHESTVEQVTTYKSHKTQYKRNHLSLAIFDKILCKSSVFI
jgi:hypothetical protein